VAQYRRATEGGPHNQARQKLGREFKATNESDALVRRFAIKAISRLAADLLDPVILCALSWLFSFLLRLERFVSLEAASPHLNLLSRPGVKPPFERSLQTSRA